MKRFALLLFVLLLVGCASKTEDPKQGVITQPTQPVTTVCKEGTDKLSLAGVKLLDPAEPVLQRLGKADNVAHSAQAPLQTYEYGFGRPSVSATVTVWQGRIFSLELRAFPVAHPLSELWSGIRFGENRETVMQALAKQGFCPAASSGNTVEFVRLAERLTLTFNGGGQFERAVLALEKPPTELQGDNPDSPVGFYPPDVKTGTPEIDKVIQAAGTKDSATLASLVRMSNVACTTQVHGMPGKPICPEGTPDGTLVEVFPAGSCEVYFINAQAQAEQMLRSRFTEPYYLYGVFKLGEPGGEFSAKYGVILGTGAEGVGVTLYLDAQGSVVQVVACSGPANMVPQGANFILLPRDAQLG
ncbi:MAG TPA: hypothetical protein VK191_06070 [Symbiobacteriaceae bacterium]|nr:hypothetical protein [Symbiobacteriaceae bacterium]